MNNEIDIQVVASGTISYDTGLELQSSLRSDVLAGGTTASILLLEHSPPVITIGRHGKKENLLISEEQAAEKKVQVRRISRGGDVTVHENGQLVLYFIFPLPSKTGGIFADILLRSLQLFVSESFGVDLALRDKLPGLWAGEAKVASIGLDVTGNVSMHGMSLNVCNSLETFQYIRPCGMDRQVTSLSKILEKDFLMEDVLKRAAGFYRDAGGRFIKKALNDLS